MMPKQVESKSPQNRLNTPGTSNSPDENQKKDKIAIPNWLKVNVDPSSREVSSYETQIVNRDVLVP
jgi:hypothetical protein